MSEPVHIDQNRRSRKLEQIRALLDKADSTEFEEEASALRAKADDLMLAYSISEFEANQRKNKDVREQPELRHIRVTQPGSPIQIELIYLFDEVVRHARCKATYSGLTDRQGIYGSTANVVGFPSDLDYVDLLFTSLHIQLSSELKPKPDPSLTEIENIVMLKEAGLKWEQEIWPLMRPGQPYHRSTAIGWGNGYTKFCKDNDRPRNYTNPTTYQRNFAQGYYHKVGSRLYEIRQRQQREQTGGTGMELALRDIKAEVDSFAADTFGRVRGVKSKFAKFDSAANNRGSAAGARADLGQSRVSKRKEIG